MEAELLDIAQVRTTSYLAETGYFPKVAARTWRWGPEMREAALTSRRSVCPLSWPTLPPRSWSAGRASRTPRPHSLRYSRSYTPPRPMGRSHKLSPPGGDPPRSLSQ
ncbi:DUF1932 domain-containing protein [Streptomyces sp. NPDC046759]|uniref:DUF1932 domain-containing protein n=1 Tax=Streptomyces sp. NPDC046759 TaxID=3155019 RepID=UPI0034099B09